MCLVRENENNLLIDYVYYGASEQPNDFDLTFRLICINKGIAIKREPLLSKGLGWTLTICFTKLQVDMLKKRTKPLHCLKAHYLYGWNVTQKAAAKLKISAVIFEMVNLLQINYF